MINKEELEKEPLFMTWGRILTLVNQSPIKTKRLRYLIEKLNKDLQKARIEEKYYL